MIQGWITINMDCTKWWEGPTRSSHRRMVSSKFFLSLFLCACLSGFIFHAILRKIEVKIECNSMLVSLGPCHDAEQGSQKEYVKGFRNKSKTSFFFFVCVCVFDSVGNLCKEESFT